MKHFLKKSVLICLILLCTAFSAFSLDLADLQKNVSNFSETIAKSLPFNSSLGMNWSDAYIGKFFPSFPPHFGVGGSFGVTTMDMPSMRGIADLLDYDIPGSDLSLFSGKMIIPAYAAEARIGGFFLPFDIGVKFGKLPPIEWLGASYGLHYTMFGADVRWAILQGNVILPKVSIGVGFNYLSGGIGATLGSGSSFDFNYLSTPYTLAVPAPEFNLLWKTYGIEARAQISKQILILTPYAGIGAGYSWSEAGYELKTDVTLNGSSIGQAQKDTIKGFLDAAGLAGMDIDANGFSSIVKNTTFNARAFGGISFNILVLKIDLTLMYNLLDGQFGAQAGVRVQL